MDIIIYNEQSNLFEYSGIRPAFIPSAEPYQPGSVAPTSNTDICHSISFYTIVTGIVNALNLFVYNSINSRDQFVALDYIIGMIVSVRTIQIESAYQYKLRDWIDKNRISPYYDLLCSINYAIGKDNGNEYSIYIKTYIAAKASEIVRLLNSEPSNLRIGYSKWNRSVLSAYDPISFSCKDGSFILDNERDQIRITNLLRYTIGSFYDNVKIPGATDALFFYTFTNPETKNTYLCSSNLDENIWRNASECKPCSYHIVYFDYIEQKEVEISTYTS